MVRGGTPELPRYEVGEISRDCRTATALERFCKRWRGPLSLREICALGKGIGVTCVTTAFSEGSKVRRVMLFCASMADVVRHTQNPRRGPVICALWILRTTNAMCRDLQGT